ncbi:protein CutA, chloroplastic isoform X2 [Lycium barbarum]|uniref:protein CutA, chloroplastic isoform X1 n=1 Tax=Lycium barbarum TaxID=112863 RepID=UPI00293F417F|nr:protein CutA, chloroplastic isoform X1 [Lycium barbarum]XP_060199014.1 protein CutA, chloroplastic isoform X2 [Lycium barbarum]
MALTLSAITSSTLIRRKLPIVGAFCVLTFGFSNLSIPFTKPGFAHSLGWKLGGERQCTSVSSIRMEATSSKIVPSIVVYVTVPNKELGKKLAGSIVKEKLAACVNRVPGVESVYEWQGEVQTDSEELLIIKTRESLLEALTEHVKANHEYDVPEVIAMPIVGGCPQYLEWLKNSTRDK